jgi:hypothetical protein
MKMVMGNFWRKKGSMKMVMGRGCSSFWRQGEIRDKFGKNEEEKKIGVKI